MAEPNKTQMIRVEALKPPPDPVGTGSDAVYALTVVTADFKQKEMPCTKEVYIWAKTSNPHFKVRVDWVLAVDPTTKLVTSCTEKPKPSDDTFRVAEDRPATDSHLVIVSLHPDGKTDIGKLPARVPEAIAAEIQDKIMEAKDEIHPGMLLGRFVVAERRELPGRTDIYVDPMPRQ